MLEHAFPQSQQLPRIYTRVSLDDGADLLRSAIALAQAGAEDATLLYGCHAGPVMRGDKLLWQPQDGDLAFAIIVRSELDRQQAAELGLVLATALGQAIATRITPLTLLQLQWPDQLLLNEGRFGRIWLEALDQGRCHVLGAVINLPARDSEQALDFASLAADGGAEDTDPEGLLLDVSRLFLRLLNHWSDAGLKQCLAFWRNRTLAPGLSAPAALAENGDLLLETDKGETRLGLSTHWFDNPPR